MDPSTDETLPKSPRRKIDVILYGVIGVMIIGILIFVGLSIRAVLFKPEAPRSQTERDYFQYSAQVKKDPKNLEARLHLATAYYDMDEPDKAIGELKTIIRQKPKWAPAHYNLAMIYLNEKKADLGIKELKETIKAQPRHDLAHYQLGQVYLGRKDYKKSIDAFKKALEITPEAADIHYYLGLAYEKDGRDELATKEYKSTLVYIPDHKEAKEALKRIEK